MADRDDLDIDLGGFGRILARSWWIVLILVLAGALAGALIAAYTGRTYDAAATIFLGQPTDALGNDLAGVQNNPTAAADLATSQRVLEEAALAAGPPMTPGRLRRATEVEIPPQVGRSSSQPISTIIVHVRYGQAVPAAEGANALAAALAAELGQFATQKIALLEERVEQAATEVATLDARAEAAQDALDAIAASDQSDAEKAFAGAPYLTIIQSVAQTRSTVETQLQNDRISLLIAEDIEQPRVIKLARTPERTAGTDWRVGAGGGVLAGAAVGLIVAFIRARQTPAA
ncbi:MAG: hypothetical protein FJ000_05830, partial [Actinobacteria bacterium]|nr:hypothetical protein [Actinomycetota bacterium]